MITRILLAVYSTVLMFVGFAAFAMLFDLQISLSIPHREVSVIFGLRIALDLWITLLLVGFSCFGCAWSAAQSIERICTPDEGVALPPAHSRSSQFSVPSLS
jgi:hypothetical protein